MRLLVTGGAGVIGSNFVRRALGGAYPGLRHAQVTGLDKLVYSASWPTSLRSRAIRACASSSATSVTRTWSTM